jgi:replicative superfamily II helicase
MNYLLQSATGDGKSIIAYGAIIARCHGMSVTIHKALYTISYKKLAEAKGEEIAHHLSAVTGKELPKRHVRVVQGIRPKRGLALTKIILAAYEHMLYYLICANTQVKSYLRNDQTCLTMQKCYKIVIIDKAHMLFDGGRSFLVNQIVRLARCLSIPLALLTGTLQKSEWRLVTLRLGH